MAMNARGHAPELNPPGSSLAGALACLFALLAGGAGLALIGALPAERTAVLSAPILLGGAAYPLLLRATPGEPAFLKVLLFGVLGSPFVLLLIAAVARLFLPPRQAMGAAFLAVAFLQPLALGRPLRFERPGAAAVSALALAVGLGSYLAWLLFADAGGARQLVPGALRHAGLAQGLLRAGPLENPWLAGTPAHWASAYHGLTALVAASLELDVVRAQAVLAVGAATCMPLALYFLAAPIWQRAGACALAAPMALFGWNAAAGLRGLSGPPQEGLGFWAQQLAQLTGSATPGALHYGLSSFVAAGPELLATTLAVAAWMAGAHALRHGARPWPALCALLHLAAISVDPRLGVVAGLATLCAYVLLVLRPTTRKAAGASMGWAALAILLLGFALVRLLPAGSSQYPEPAPWDAHPSNFGLALVFAAGPMLVLGLLGLLPSARRMNDGEGNSGGGVVALLLGVAVLIPAAGAAHELLGVGKLEHLARPAADILRLGSFPLGVLAAGGLASLLRGSMGRRVVGASLALILGFGAVRMSLHAAGAHQELAQLQGPLVERGTQLDLAQVRPQDEAFAAALMDLREDPVARAGNPILLCALDAGGPPREGPEFARNRLHLAGLVADMPLLLCVSRQVEFGQRQGPQREELLSRAFTSDKGASPEWVPLLVGLERPVVVLVRETDRVRTTPVGKRGSARGIELDLGRFGAKTLWRNEQLTLLRTDYKQAGGAR
ncbi:MAG: hypothetical protein ACI8QC_003305 [Planctomycetota bacterium]|jgi:hypothetical protein